MVPAQLALPYGYCHSFRGAQFVIAYQRAGMQRFLPVGERYAVTLGACAVCFKLGIYCEKLCVRGIVPGLGRNAAHGRNRIECGGYHAGARVAVNRAERAEAPQRYAGNARFLLQFARGSGGKLLVHFNESTRQRPAAYEGMVAAAYKHNAKLAPLIEREYHHVHRYGRAAVLVFIICGKEFGQRLALFVARFSLCFHLL